MSVDHLTVTITADTSGFDAAMHRVWLSLYRLRVRWAWQPSDPNPMPRFRLFAGFASRAETPEKAK